MKYDGKLTGRVNPDEERRKRLERGELTELEYNVFVKSGFIPESGITDNNNKRFKVLKKEEANNIEFDKTDENVISDAISRNENVRNMSK